MGGVPDQHMLLLTLETKINKGAKATAVILGTSYDTYKSWKSNHRNMTTTVHKLVQVMLRISGTPLGAEFGV